MSADSQRLGSDFDNVDIAGVSPDGGVRVTMRGGRLAALTIDPSAMNHDNVYLAGQVQAAIRQAEESSREFLTKRTAPMMRTVEELRDKWR